MAFRLLLPKYARFPATVIPACVRHTGSGTLRFIKGAS